jgi:hypothetical protein
MSAAFLRREDECSIFPVFLAFSKYQVTECGIPKLSRRSLYFYPSSLLLLLQNVSKCSYGLNSSLNFALFFIQHMVDESVCPSY